MTTPEERLELFKQGWKGESPCGSGSSIAATGHLVKWIPGIVDKYNMYRICEIGAGDKHWVSRIKWFKPTLYRGFDIHPRHPDVIPLDGTKQVVFSCDMILCRMVMVHLSQKQILEMLALIKESAEYLMATNYHSPDPAKQDSDALFHHVRLTDEIYGLGEPIERIRDTNSMCDLALWRL